MTHTKRLILIFLIGIMITACKKEETIQTGKLIGFITLYDENGNLLQDKSGVNINAIGSSSFNTTSTSDGRFEIDNLPMGTYNINFTKQGFAETKRIGLNFIGGTNPTIIAQSMCKPTTTSVNLLSLTFDTVNYEVKANCKINSNVPIGSEEFVRFYYGTSDTVSYTNYDYSSGIGVDKLANDTMTHSIWIDGITLNNYYASGTKIYIVAYGEPSNLSTTYTNINTGKTIYPGLNLKASQIKSIIIP